MPARSRHLGLSVFAAAALLSACGSSPAPSGADSGPCGAPAVGSCDQTSPEHLCTDYDGGSVLLGMAESSCTSMGGTWSATPCSHTASLGGCRSTPSSCVTTIGWYYEGGSVLDAATLMSACDTAAPGSYVAP